jgi:hypothetical protein
MAGEDPDVKKGWTFIGLGAVVLLGGLALGRWLRSPRVPPRPAGLPAGAEWAGQGSSGRFFLVEGRQGMVYSIHVFEARGGVPAPVTRWRLVGFARTGLNADEIAGLEGGAILLKDGSKLLPAE